MAVPEQCWPAWGATPALSEQDVHLLSASLDQPPERVNALALLLSPEEQKRAARFHFERHRRRFTVGRGWLRAVLAGYLGVVPQALEFAYGSHGKPVLAGRWAGTDLRFNLSHSEELGLLGVTRGREIGVDVEWVRHIEDGMKIAERFFSEQEWKGIYSVPQSQQDEAFFNCWTRKEAYLKAVGTGLSHPLNQVIVTVRPDEPACFISIDSNPALTAEWSVRHLAPATSYLGAVVTAGEDWQLSCWKWG